MFSEEQKLFEDTWHKKFVYFSPKENAYEGIPEGIYLITAALYHYEEDETISVIAIEPKVTKTPAKWYTIKCNDSDLEELLEQFKIISIDEVLNFVTFEKEVPNV